MSQSPTPAPGTPSGSAPVDPPRRRRPAWLIPLIAAVVVLLLLLLLLSQCAGGDDDDTAGTAGSGAEAGSGAATSTAAPSPSLSPSPSVSATPEDDGAAASPTATPSTLPSTASPEDSSSATPTTGAGGAEGTDGDATLVTADETSVLALAGDDAGAGLASVDGQDVQATGVAVESVPADEGFWVGSGDQRVWAQLDGEGESAFEVETGEQLSFSAQVVANDDAFVDTVGITAAEGAEQLQQQGYHLAVDRSTVTAEG